SETLELVAKILGFHDWNVLSARIQSEDQPPLAKPGIAATAAPPDSGGTGPPALALRDIGLLPQMSVPPIVGRDASKRAGERAMAGDSRSLPMAERRAAGDKPSR